MKKWEYLEVNIMKLKGNDVNEFSSKYNEPDNLGAQGWEVVFTNIARVYEEVVYCVLLKRGFEE